MSWTAEEPTRPGWYWYRPTPKASPYPVKIFDANLLYVWPVNDRATNAEKVTMRLADCAGEFAGPIEPPLAAGNYSERREYTAIKLVFRLASVLPADQPLSVSLLRLMMASNDVRHIQMLLLAKDERYKLVPEYHPTDKDPYGQPLRIGSRLEIDPEQAKQVRWIFQSFAEGMSPVKIVDELNRRKVPPPGVAFRRKSRLVPT